MNDFFKMLVSNTTSGTKKFSLFVYDGLQKLLYYARINDEKNRISLTNVAMIIVLYKIAVTSATSFEDITALTVAVLGYQVKRQINKE